MKKLMVGVILFARIAYIALYVPLWLFGVTALALHLLSEGMAYLFIGIVNSFNKKTGWYF